jgi:diguanylate cyclase (GGDEF)-like protein
MELLVGVLLFSVMVNVALFFWLSQADHVKVHWSASLQTLFNSLRPRPEVDEFPTLRRRSLFVAGSAGANPSGMRVALTETLPPDLAEFLSSPAPIGPRPDGFNVAPSEGQADGVARAVVTTGENGSGMVARMSDPSNRQSTELALDLLTGLEGPASWTRIMEIENARLLRYRRPATVVMAEVEGLRRLAERMGDEPVDRLLPVIADALRREARSSDWVARVGKSRFAAFLPETDEIQAINYVERIRLECEPWLASSAVPLRLAIGWSSPGASSDLEYAFQQAEERMHADRRMPGKPVGHARVAPARVVSVAPASARSTAPLGQSGTQVPPAETGRDGEGSRAISGSEQPVGDKSQEVSAGKGRRRSHRPELRSDDSSPA